MDGGRREAASRRGARSDHRPVLAAAVRGDARTQRLADVPAGRCGGEEPEGVPADAVSSRKSPRERGRFGRPLLVFEAYEPAVEGIFRPMARRLLILAAVALAAAPAATQAARLLHPRLTLSPEPVVVRGSGFHAQERVLVRVYAGGSYFHRVTATTRGTFRVAFPNAS